MGIKILLADVPHFSRHRSGPDEYWVIPSACPVVEIDPPEGQIVMEIDDRQVESAKSRLQRHGIAEIGT